MAELCFGNNVRLSQRAQYPSLLVPFKLGMVVVDMHLRLPSVFMQRMSGWTHDPTTHVYFALPLAMSI